MDEPAAGLDPLFRKELTGYMQELVEDGTRSVLFSTHLTSDLDQIGDYNRPHRRGPALLLHGQGEPARTVRPPSWNGSADPRPAQSEDPFRRA